MLLELARPVCLLASLISLLAVFHAAFLGSETDFSQRIWDVAGMLLLAAGFSLLGGLVFLEGRSKNERGNGSGSARENADASRQRAMRITETFPMQVFWWTTGIMAILFVLSWYLKTHCIFYRDIHF